MAEIIVMRHGQTDGNKMKVLNQAPCPGLNEDGQQEVFDKASNLEEVHRIWTSFMWRARQTAEIAGRLHGVTPEIMTGLHERHLGILENMSVEQIDALKIVGKEDIIHAKNGTRYVEGKYGAESFDATVGRTGRALKIIRRKLKLGQRGLIVTHGDAGLALCAAASGVPMREAIDVFHFENAGVAVIDDEGNVSYEGTPVLESRRSN
ncbi:TPA: hypothetical protein DIV49_03880 [Candidatus Saccharibacteria bacterium]|nr:hypothetical protein [Candidatus Saccharibacteria bacterium]HRJ91024.1 histidine phosphatase family protein [Candidatus Saccharibacteria bacterium]